MFTQIDDGSLREENDAMSNESFASRMETALRDPHLTDAQASEASRLLLDQSDRLEKRCGRSYLLFIGFAAGYTMLSGTSVKTLSMFGVTLERAQPATLLLIVLAAYFLYQAASATVVGQLVSDALEVMWQERLSPFERNGILPLFEHFTPFRTESVIATVEYLPYSRFSTASTFAIMIALAAAPAIWFLVASYWIVATPTYPWFAKLASMVIVWTLIARCIVLLVQYIALMVNQLGRAVARKLFATKRESPAREAPVESPQESA